MKMPAIERQLHANGFSKMANSLDQLDGEKLANKLANKKLDMMERENGAQRQDEGTQEAEVFHDTSAQGAHSSRKDEEPIVIYDTQSNTSIAQTAKDQFAAALLRLQSGLAASITRLEAIEKRVDIMAQQRQQQSRSNQDASAAKKSSWLSPTKNGHLNTLIYFSWPVLVYVTMRALERRSLLRKIE